MKKSFFLTVTILVAGIAALFYHYKSLESGTNLTQKVSFPVSVEGVTAKQATWQRQIHITGSLIAFQGITLKSALVKGGIIQQIHFNSGDEVKKGQPLFTIYPGNTVIAAPFSGKLGLKQVDLGELVTNGMPLVTLQQIDPLKVQFTVPQAYLSFLDKGDIVEITTSAYPDEIFKGKVFAIDNQLDADTRSLKAWAELPNPTRKLYPGMFVDVLVFSNSKQQVISVPRQALVYAQSAISVYKIIDDKAVKTMVKVGIAQGDEVQIIEGIAEGDKIVSAGQLKITDGSMLSVKTEG